MHEADKMHFLQKMWKCEICKMNMWKSKPYMVFMNTQFQKVNRIIQEAENG